MSKTTEAIMDRLSITVQYHKSGVYLRAVWSWELLDDNGDCAASGIEDSGDEAWAKASRALDAYVDRLEQQAERIAERNKSPEERAEDAMDVFIETKRDIA